MPGIINTNGGSTTQPRKITMVNRTGATLQIGDLVAQNRDFSATSGNAMVGLDPTSQADSSAGWLFGAAVAITTENMSRGLWPAAAVILDNAEGEFFEEGECLVNQNGSNAGEFLCGTNAQVYATPYTLTELDSLAAPTRFFGIALAAGTTGTPVKALWNARGDFMCGGGG